MTVPTPPSCRSCTFGDLVIYTHDPHVEPDGMPAPGLVCRRRPPVVLSCDGSTGWPTVDAADWCGEWEPGS